MSDDRIGIWAIMPTAETLDIISRHLDFVILDKEHGNFSDRDIFTLCHSTSERADIWVRPRENTETEVLHILDSGVYNIIFPHVQTGEQAKELISYCKFPPEGCRGYSPFVSGNAYSEDIEKAYLNRCIYVGFIIEDMVGVMNLDVIIETDPTMIYIGVYDLASSLGTTIDDPKVKKIFTQITLKAHAKGIAVGGIFHDKKGLDFLRQNEVDYCVFSTDTALLRKAVREYKQW